MGVTNLETHKGKTKRFRCQATAPTDPTPERGDVYVDNSSGAEALAIYNGFTWIYLSLVLA